MERSDVRKARQQREGHESHPDPTVARLIDEARAQAWDEGALWAARVLLGVDITLAQTRGPGDNPYRKADQ